MKADGLDAPPAPASEDPPGVPTDMLRHVGPSMVPTLRDGDLLKMASLRGALPRTGDVVVFRPAGAKHRVAHRVIGPAGSGLRTAGDNNDTVDAEVLDPQRISGRVEACWRGGRRHLVRGGRSGALQGRITRSARRLLRRGRVLLGTGGRIGLGRTRGGRAFPARRDWRVVTYLAPGGTRYQLLAGKKVVGTYDPRRARWTVRWPYRLFIDVGTLPTGGPGAAVAASKTPGQRGS